VRLLATALKLFTAAQQEVTLSAVAERAGVGIGTPYRHFPTRDALVEAVYRHEVEPTPSAG
jgi:AcrR family transcriptional regulator